MDIGTFMKAEASLFLALLFATVIYFMLTGRINMKGLLNDKCHGRISPGRIQLLVVAMTSFVVYILNALHSPNTGTLPAFPHDPLLIFGGSNVVYLSGKFYSALQNRGKPKIEFGRKEG
ncbi:MAG: hypothetical protein ABSC19_10215 [Syntrophorhabdales bacterium]|jgi:hypothetical protein